MLKPLLVAFLLAAAPEGEESFETGDTTAVPILDQDLEDKQPAPEAPTLSEEEAFYSETEDPEFTDELLATGEAGSESIAEPLPDEGEDLQVDFDEWENEPNETVERKDLKTLDPANDIPPSPEVTEETAGEFDIDEEINAEVRPDHGQDDLEKELQRGEPPYPGSTAEEFAGSPRSPQMGYVEVETEQGTRKVPHPMANKGLVRITKSGAYIFSTKKDVPKPSQNFAKKGLREVGRDGTYYYSEDKHQPVKDHPWAEKGLISQEKGFYRYKVKESPREGTFSFRFGASTAPEYSQNVGGTTVAFKDIYKENQLFQLGVTREWGLWNSQSLRFALGVSGTIATGSGVYANRPTVAAPEKYNIYIIPVTFNIVYRAQFFDSQKLLPFFGGGPGISGIAERRTDGKIASAITPVVHAFGGIGLNMDVLDYQRMNQLDSTDGINDIYMTIQFHTEQALNKELNFSSSSLALGFVVDY